MTETMELVRIEDVQNAVQIFTKGGLNAILDEIETKVRSIPLDPSTAPGREEIRSVAYRVIRSKTLLDSEGKKLTEEWRKATSLVNAERKKAIERLDALAEEIRKPLTDFENRDKIRVAAHEQALADMTQVADKIQAGVFAESPLPVLQMALANFSEMHKGREWDEFRGRAIDVHNAVMLALGKLIEARKKFDADQEELARLRAAEAERIQRERDECMKAEAAEKARLEEQRKAREAADAERKRVEAEADATRREHEAALKAAAEVLRKAEEEAERKRLEEEHARIFAEKRAEEERQARLTSERNRIAAEKKAEAERLAAEVRAASELKAAQEKAKVEAEASAKREREKIAAEQKSADDARLKREADKKHAQKIYDDILDDLTASCGAGKMAAAAIAVAIMAGKIRHIKVVY